MTSVAAAGKASSKLFEKIGRALRSHEMLLLPHKPFDPHRERVGRCIRRGAEFADAGDELQHEAADLALQVEMLALEMQPHQTGADDRRGPDECQRNRDQRQLGARSRASGRG